MRDLVTINPERKPSKRHERDHAACGIGLIANFPRRQNERLMTEASHQMVRDALRVLKKFGHRGGYNPVTKESDGAGLRFFGLSTAFFNKLIRQNYFLTPAGAPLVQTALEAGRFAIGHYFFPTQENQISEAKSLIEDCAAQHDLVVAGWRYVNQACDSSVLSESTLQKMPAIWQALFLPAQTNELFEQRVLAAGLEIGFRAENWEIPIDILSQSSESIVYKGMLRPSHFEEFYLDLQDSDFTASAVIFHDRFATNKRPVWSRAQPSSFFIAHNGELNSAPANAVQMHGELDAEQFKGVYPHPGLSDSMQFDADIANQMAMKHISLAEAFVRLMGPACSDQYSPEMNAMLQCFQLERTSYNGPAFMVAGHNGYYLAKLDNVGLRPSRWALIEDKDGNKQLLAASEDYFQAPEGGRIIKKGHLEPGGMLMLTPEGDLLTTVEILEFVNRPYQNKTKNFFELQLKKISTPLIPHDNIPHPFFTDKMALNRRLYDAGWDHESDEVVRYMAENAMERTGAMGNDTDSLHATRIPMHLSYFFHQLFAQVSAPPLDSIKERARFSLLTALGNTPSIRLQSPILMPGELSGLGYHFSEKLIYLSMGFELDPSKTPLQQMQAAIKALLTKVENAVRHFNVSIIVLTDGEMTGASHAFIPDMIAVAAVRKHLENNHLARHVSIVADSNQITGPHQAAALLAVGANAVYPRGAYESIYSHFEDHPEKYCENFRKSLEKCLLKTMGKMGITDVNNYANGHLLAALGLDLEGNDTSLVENPQLATIFPRIYSPLKGLNLGHIAANVLTRHEIAYHAEADFTLLPRSGYYMPEKDGIKHGYSHEVVNAFTKWMNQENLRAKLFQLDTILRKKGLSGYSSPDMFSIEQGFLDPGKKDENDRKGFYPESYLEEFKVSPFFKLMSETIDNHRRKNPIAIRDHFKIKTNAAEMLAASRKTESQTLQSQESIRSLIYSGSMSQGALTATDPENPEKTGAHETLTRGMNAVGANSASGEGGEAYDDLRDPLKSTTSKQIASGRFNVSAMQILCADEIEIKVAQGAKPGEGGELPGYKVTIRFAAQRGGLPGNGFISPPPHHDIYSIEDLEQLIQDIKCIKPDVNVAVKLVSSEGIGTIALGVAKAGADVINIAADDGGTGAAQQSSIKHAGLPLEVGLAEVDTALRIAGLRELVKLRVSGGFKTANDVIMAAILGGDLFEFGTSAMLTLGCKMQRTCNHSCQPGVATDGHLFEGEQINTERYVANLAADIQDKLKTLGVSQLSDLRGRTDLLEIVDPELLKEYDFSPILNRENLPPPPSPEVIAEVRESLKQKTRSLEEEKMIADIQQSIEKNPISEIELPTIEIANEDRCFGAHIIGSFAKHLEDHPKANISLNTSGNAGQSYGCFMAHGITLNHQGPVQDSCGKSMTGGKLIIRTPEQREDYAADKNTIAGNAMFYGASGGKAFVNGVAGHRFGILMKGAQVVVEGTGDLAFEYMTSGTGMILGDHGKDLCTGATGGIVFVYDPDNKSTHSDSVRLADSKEQQSYLQAIKSMLTEHLQNTDSLKAKHILENFNLDHFKILIPTELDKVHSLKQVIDICKTYQLRKSPMTAGMQVWFEQNAIAIVESALKNPEMKPELVAFGEFIRKNSLPMLSRRVLTKLMSLTHKPPQFEDLGISLISTKHKPSAPILAAPKQTRSVEVRLDGISGTLDDSLLDAFKHINSYVAELTHDANGCSGCRAQSCSGVEKEESGCPGGKAINTINDYLKQIGTINVDTALTKKQWKLLRKAFETQIKETPFIAYTGAACPAPCQDACTETIPDLGAANPKRDGKRVGEYVHIKDIEYYLYQIGRSLGWLDGQAETVIPGESYKAALNGFKVPFRRFEGDKRPDKELIIVGSGPAAMQMAFEALRDGVAVRMYEKSDQPGGLLMDGIPAHKFDKAYLKEDFVRLQNMGLQLHLNSEVSYDEKTGDYKINSSDTVIANSTSKNQFVAVCVGAGKPRTLPKAVVSELDEPGSKRIIQAADFLQAANKIARELKANPNLTDEQKEALIKQHFGQMDPRNKKIVVVGGGDTAQDVIRWVARYFNQEDQLAKGELDVFVRGFQPQKRAILDAYPLASRAPTHENELRVAEVGYIQGRTSHLVEPSKVSVNADGKLDVELLQSAFKYYDQIQADPEAKRLFDELPRESRPLDEDSVERKTLSGVDMIICALGYQDRSSIPLVKALETAQVNNVFFAGDVTREEQAIIIGAQANAKNTYSQIRKAMHISDVRPLATMSIFSAASKTFSSTEHAPTTARSVRT